MFEEKEKERGKIVNKGIIHIAKELGIEVVAEGVETREYVDFLKEQNCDLVQGFYFGKPMPVEEFETLMRKLNMKQETSKKQNEVYVENAKKVRET